MKTTFSLFALAFVTLMIGMKSITAQNTFPPSGAAGIGTASPNGSSLLDINSTTKGMLAPRMTKAQRDAIVSPATGLLVFQTNNTPGFYYYSGSAWTAVSSKDASKDLSNLTPTAINQSLLPNATGTLDLGSSSLKWKDAYVSNIKFADGTTQSTAGGGGGSETDPQVGTNTTNYIPKWNGSALTSGILQDDGNELQVGPVSFWSFAKVNIEQSTHNYTLNLVNALTGTGSTTGIYNIFSGSATGAKTGIRNEVGTSSSGTGNITGTDNSIANGGSGISYGTFNFLGGSGNAAHYGSYSQFTGSGSGAKYGDYYDFSGASANGAQYGVYVNAPSSTGTIYGTYLNIAGTGTITGSYINMPSSSGTTKYGLRVNAASTSGLTYGIHSTVSASNPSAYAGYFDGQVKCTDKVGIGTSSALTVKLQVDGGTDAELASGGYLVVGNTNTTNIAIDGNEIMARSDGQISKLHLNNDGGDVSMCYAGGNVMIGASVPANGYLLSVDGKIMCEELKVQMSENWPDYVFADDYKLTSLYDLEQSIKANRHLPGIPAASEIAEEGIEIGAMQKMMMEKIEELTLYIIQQQKEMESQQKEIDALKKQISE